MPHNPRRSPDPWLRSVDESFPPSQRRGRRITRLELLVVVAVAAVVLAMAIWFLFIASGGPGPGTV
jgi:hypothetical protein